MNVLLVLGTLVTLGSSTLITPTVTALNTIGVAHTVVSGTPAGLYTTASAGLTKTTVTFHANWWIDTGLIGTSQSNDYWFDSVALPPGSVTGLTEKSILCATSLQLTGEDTGNKGSMAVYNTTTNLIYVRHNFIGAGGIEGVSAKAYAGFSCMWERNTI